MIWTTRANVIKLLYPIGTPFRFSGLVVGSWPYPQTLNLERPATDKHSSSFGPFISCKEKSFIKLSLGLEGFHIYFAAKLGIG
jgi:hypothetical protein